MAEHIRLQALKKLCVLLEAETGMQVFRGRQVVGNDVKMPFLVINETIRSGDTIQTAHRTLRNDRTDFLLSGYIDMRDVKHPIDIAYGYVAKIEQAFSKIYAVKGSFAKPAYPEWYNLGGLVTNFNYLAPVCHNPPDEAQSKVYFYFYFNFHVAYDSADPSAKVDVNCD